MIFNVSSDSKSILNSDLGRKYLISGKRISGDISKQKFSLYLEDDYGKHSAFISNYFYGEFLSENKIKGKFRPATFVIILLAVLFAVAVESLTVSLLFKNYDGIFMPIIVIVAEIFYFFILKRLSFQNDELIKKYIENL